jgi:hypothetical protein
MSGTAILDPAEGTHMPTNKANRLLKQLMQKIEEIYNREIEASARIRMLETSSQLPGRRTDAIRTPTPTPLPTTMPIAKSGRPAYPYQLKATPNLTSLSHV